MQRAGQSDIEQMKKYSRLNNSASYLFTRNHRSIFKDICIVPATLHAIVKIEGSQAVLL
jgi:hypothetical protein